MTKPLRISIFFIILFFSSGVMNFLLVLKNYDSANNAEYTGILNQNIIQDFNFENIKIRLDSKSDPGYLGLSYRKQDLELIPDFIPINQFIKISYSVNDTSLNIISDNLEFYMLFDTQIFNWKTLIKFSNLRYFIAGLVFILILFFMSIKILDKLNLNFKYNVLLVISISFIFIGTLNELNNFKILHLKTYHLDDIISQKMRKSILSVPIQKYNYNLYLIGNLITETSPSDNTILMSSIGGSDNYLYSRDNKIFAQQSLRNLNNEVAPYKQEIFTPLKNKSKNPKNFELQVEKSRFIVLKSDFKIGGKRGFYYPVMNSDITFPKINSKIIQNVKFNLNVYAQTNSLKIFEKLILLNIIFIFFLFIRKSLND